MSVDVNDVQPVKESVILESLGSNLDGKVYRDFSEKRN